MRLSFALFSFISTVAVTSSVSSNQKKIKGEERKKINCKFVGAKQCNWSTLRWNKNIKKENIFFSLPGPSWTLFFRKIKNYLCARVCMCAVKHLHSLKHQTNRFSFLLSFFGRSTDAFCLCRRSQIFSIALCCLHGIFGAKEIVQCTCAKARHWLKSLCFYLRSPKLIVRRSEMKIFIVWREERRGKKNINWRTTSSAKWNIFLSFLRSFRFSSSSSLTF